MSRFNKLSLRNLLIVREHTNTHSNVMTTSVKITALLARALKVTIVITQNYVQ